jgi:hypothetical protein
MLYLLKGSFIIAEAFFKRISVNFDNNFDSAEIGILISC